MGGAREKDREPGWERLVVVLLVTSFMVYTALKAYAQQEEPVWKWTPEQIITHVNKVRSGKDLTPKRWPNGARMAVSLSCDFDTEPVWLGFQKQQSPSYMSRGEYGARAGMPRIMAMLDKYKIPATFFIPAISMVLHPEVIDDIKRRPQHEFGFHSYVHENPLRADGEGGTRSLREGDENFCRESREEASGIPLGGMGSHSGNDSVSERDGLSL